jgi:hypothetical protein
MIQRLLLSAILAVGLRGQVGRSEDASLRRFEQQLAAVLRWEILWNDSPTGFHVSPNGSATFALHSSPNALSYCSRDVGVCARYKIGPTRNWELVASDRCDGGQSNQDALLAFDGENVERPVAKAASRPRHVFGPGGLTGSPMPGFGVLWAATIRLASREETVRQYRQMRPAEIEGLKEWILASRKKDAGVKSITIACFAPSDPMVYYYVDGPGKEAGVLAVFWNREREEWIVAAALERSQNPGRFEEMHRITDSIACSTIKLE